MREGSSPSTCHMSLSWVMCHMSHVTCHMSHVTCHMSHVTCHMSHVTCNFLLDIVLKLVGGGSVINGAYPFSYCTLRGPRLSFLCMRLVQCMGRQCTALYYFELGSNSTSCSKVKKYTIMYKLFLLCSLVCLTARMSFTAAIYYHQILNNKRMENLG